MEGLKEVTHGGGGGLTTPVPDNAIDMNVPSDNRKIKLAEQAPVAAGRNPTVTVQEEAAANETSQEEVAMEKSVELTPLRDIPKISRAAVEVLPRVMV